MLTTRDFDIIEFVNNFKIADTSTISNLFFPSLDSCRKRLKVIFDNNKLNRVRDNINCEYVYFIKKPKQYKHSLLVTKFYGYFKDKLNISKFIIEPTYGNIRPDAAFVYNDNGVSKVGLLEVEISNKGFDWIKYDSFCNNGNFSEFMTVSPKVFIVGNKVNVPIESSFEYTILNTDFQLRE